MNPFRQRSWKDEITEVEKRLLIAREKAEVAEGMDVTVKG